jgi:hypothetical protein
MFGPPMALHHHLRRLLVAAVGVLTLGGLLAACGGGQADKADVGGILGFDRTKATLANDPIPTADPNFACGGPLPFGQELVTLDNPALAHVRSEWGDVVPGKVAFMTGTAGDTELFGADLPFTHPFGNDLTFNVKLDRPYATLGQVAGTPDASGGIPQPGSIHTEIEQGILPHSAADSFLRGFLPANGDAIAAVGRWIIDCGHGDFHTEIHPPAVLAFAHREGSATVAHAFYNPYRVTELYSPNPAFANDLGNNARFSDKDTEQLPSYFSSELLRVLNGAADHITAHMLITTPSVRSVTWYACAPGPKPKGGRLSASYRFTTRPGVTLTATPEEGIGCVRFDATLGPSYEPFVPPLKECRYPWAQFNPSLKAALMNQDIDILELIRSKVPASVLPRVEQPVEFDCYDPLIVGPPGPPNGQTGIVVSDQPYPFYGDTRVSWRS